MPVVDSSFYSEQSVRKTRIISLSGGAEGGKRSRSRPVDPVVRFVFDDPDLLKFEANVIAVLQVRNTATASL